MCPDFIMSRDDELHLGESSLEQVAELPSVIAVDGHDHVVQNSESEVRAEQLFDQREIQANSHTILVTFTVVSGRREHPDSIEVDSEVKLSSAGFELCLESRLIVGVDRLVIGAELVLNRVIGAVMK